MHAIIDFTVPRPNWRRSCLYGTIKLSKRNNERFETREFYWREAYTPGPIGGAEYKCLFNYESYFTKLVPAVFEHMGMNKVAWQTVMRLLDRSERIATGRRMIDEEIIEMC